MNNHVTKDTYDEHVTSHCLYWYCQNSNHSDKLYMPSLVVAPDDNHQARATWYLPFASSILLTSLYSMKSCLC